MNPLVRQLTALRKASGMYGIAISYRAGLGRCSISKWEKQGVEPRLGNFEAALNVLGYRLAIVPLEPEG